MKIKRIVSDLLLSNMYILEENKHAVIIDPNSDTSDFESGIQYDWMLLTHEHYDHISGVNAWRNLCGAKVLCQRDCGKNITNPKKNISHYFDRFCEMQTWVEYEKGRVYEDYSCGADETFEDSLMLEWQGHQIWMFSCPGHSDGGMCIQVDKEFLFSGDSLLGDFPTECRFPGGSRMKWEAMAMPKIRKLDKKLLVYPGHFEEFVLEKWRDKGAGGK